jgi:hypothetical protein
VLGDFASNDSSTASYRIGANVCFVCAAATVAFSNHIRLLVTGLFPVLPFRVLSTAIGETVFVLSQESDAVTR